MYINNNDILTLLLEDEEDFIFSYLKPKFMVYDQARIQRKGRNQPIFSKTIIFILNIGI